MTARYDVLPCGDDAVRILCGAGPVRHALAAHLRGLAVCVDCVPGKADVTLAFDPHETSQSDFIRRLIDALQTFSESNAAQGQEHILRARFGGEDGPDLDATAAALGLTPQALISKLVETHWTLDFLGFTPGFAYLEGLDPQLKIARRATPRVRVPAGSIGVITGQAGLYALAGPGGWPLMGQVIEPLFDPSADDPFLLKPGDRVRFVRDTTA